MQRDLVEYVLVGGLREDYFITPAGAAHLGEIGGNAVYSAVGARIWTEQAGLVSRVGSNYPAEWLSVIEAHGIDTGGVAIAPRPLDTRTFYAYLSLEERDDTDPASHFARLGRGLPSELENYATSTEGQDPRTDSPLAARIEDVPAGYLGARGVHLAPYNFSVHHGFPAAMRAAGAGCITCDPSVRYMLPEYSAEVREIVASLDAFLPSEMETRAYFGPALPDLWQALEAYGAMGTGCAVIKRGASGQYVYDSASGRKWRVPAYPAQVVDVTGCGDAYCGGFLVGLTQTGDPLEAALRGCVSASMVIEGIGALFALGQPPGTAQARLAELRGAVAPV